MAKLLFIQYRRAAKVMNGGDQCTKRNYDMLCQTLGSENVDVLYMHNKENHSSFGAYILGAILMPFGYFFGLSPLRVKQIVARAKGYEYVFIDRSVFGILAKELKNNGYRGKIITHFHNVEKLYFNDKMPKRLPFRSVLLRCADINDAYACRYSDDVIVLNNRDAEQLKALYQVDVKTIIPISMPDKAADIKTSDELTSQKLKCLFVGSYFTPNNEGIIWFMRNVAPHVNVEIKIVGKGMSKLKSENQELLQTIDVVSDAPDLTPYFLWADVLILPIFSGSGMKVKTCESLMFGRNIIGTTEAFEGYAIYDKESGWRCNTADEYISCINDFISNPLPKFNKAARQLYLNHYSFDSALQEVRKMLMSK